MHGMVWIITRKTKKMRKARVEKKKTDVKNIERNIGTCLFFIDRYFPRNIT